VSLHQSVAVVGDEKWMKRLSFVPLGLSISSVLLSMFNLGDQINSTLLSLLLLTIK
jgi:hypothetical protein